MESLSFAWHGQFKLETFVLKYMLENTEGAIKNGQSRKTCNIDEEKQNKNTTQYVLDTTICKQTQIKSPSTNNWR